MVGAHQGGLHDVCTIGYGKRIVLPSRAGRVGFLRLQTLPAAMGMTQLRHDRNVVNQNTPVLTHSALNSQFFTISPTDDNATT